MSIDYEYRVVKWMYDILVMYIVHIHINIYDNEYKMNNYIEKLKIYWTSLIIQNTENYIL